ncbi:MAG TPA: pilus assembly protein N-terminal domain-containing protein [Xanthobacteraceae bacterium]|nr:pilus assembly protein N-terminal domain-containing protein [Xanthobacteraceae bacterium]
MLNPQDEEECRIAWLYIQGKKVGTTNVSVFDQSMKLIGVLDVEVAIDAGQPADSRIHRNAVAAERAATVASGQDRRR